MEVFRRAWTSVALCLALALTLLVCAGVLLSNVGVAHEPGLLQTSRLTLWQRGAFPGVYQATAKSGPASCEPGRGAGNAPANQDVGPGGGVAVSAESAPLRRCSSANFLGAWENQTFIPLPHDALAPFLNEARGVLTRAERRFFIPQRDGHDVAPAYLPVNSLSAENEPVPFSPPCYYQFYSREEIVKLFAGKWVFFFGDSNTRGMVMGLLSILDPTHRSPYSDEKWFNGTKEEVSWPHVYNLHYFFRADGSILHKNVAWQRFGEMPTSGYSFRLSYRMQHNIEEMRDDVLETLGELEWAPDVLYFNSGSWDAGKLDTDPGNWTYARFDRGYARMLDLIAQKCDPTRQICFWGTIGWLHQIYERFVVLQWRHMARIAAAQSDAGNTSTVHFLDRYWSTYGVPDQNFGSHMSLAVNVWLPQLLMNAYHSAAEERGLLANPLSLAEPSRAYLRDEVRCVLLPGDVERVRCDKYPLRVEFEKGCFIDEETDEPGVGDTHVMWARNCTASIHR